jgi:hypothetical protein
MPAESTSLSEVIVHGVLFDPKNSAWRAPMSSIELSQAVGQLFNLLEERRVDYVLVGGLAMLAHVEGRNTQDIDLIVAKEALDTLPELAVKERNAEFARTDFAGVTVDLLFAEGPVFRAVRRDHQQVARFLDRDVPCATPVGLVAMKLFALPSLYRQGNFDKVGIYEQDVMSLLRNYDIPLEVVWRILTPSVLPSDLGEIQRIAAEIKGRIAAASTRFAPPPPADSAES